MEWHMRSLLKARKAVSKIIGVLLIIIVLLAVGGFYYYYTSAYVGSMENSFQTQMEALLLESVDINSTHITASVRNNGIMEAKVTDAHVDGLASVLLRGIMIGGQSLGTTYLVGVYLKGVSYAVKLLFSLGTSLTFSIMY